MILNQTKALLIDMRRDLAASYLFWISLGISALAAVVVLIPGIDAEGIHVFGFKLPIPMTTAFVPKAEFHLRWFLWIGIDKWIGWVACILALISTASIFPRLQSQGVIDMMLARPIGRGRLFLTQYLLGLGFVAVQATVFTLVCFVGLGLRAGVWIPGILVCIPLTVILFSYIHALSALVGTLTRSTLLAVIATVLLWAVSGSIQVGDSALEGWQEKVQAKLSDHEALAAKVHGASAEDIASLKASPQKAGVHLDRQSRQALDEVTSGKPDALDQLVDTDRKTLSAMRPWVAGIRVVYTLCPKTQETVDLAGRWLVPSSHSADRGDNPYDDDEMGHPPEVAHSAGFVLGTSLAFEALLVGLALWVFKRRDF